MADYYDRLEAQLAALTERGAHRRQRLAVGRPVFRFLTERVALAASALIVVAVAAAVLAAGGGHHAPRHVPVVRSGGPAVLRNIYPAPLPAPFGPLVCDSPITAPGGGTPPSGEARFYTAPPTRTEMFLTARGLKRIGAGDVYAVWVLPAVQTLSSGYRLQSSAPPELVGVVAPSVGINGRLSVATLLPRTVKGVYKLLITVQARSSLRVPGAIALQGFINF
jgi:hypothetical protein